MINKTVEGFVCWIILVLSPLVATGFVLSILSMLAIMVILGFPAERIFRNKKLDDRISEISLNAGSVMYAFFISPIILLIELMIEPSLSVRERMKRAFTPIYI